MTLNNDVIWEQIFQATIPNYIELTSTFNDRYLSIEAHSLLALPKWIKAGNLIHLIPTTKGNAQIKRSLIVLNQLQLIEAPCPAYKLAFEPSSWLSDVIVTIYSPNMPLFSDNVASAPTVVTATATTAQKAVNNTAQSLIAANPNRKGLTIVNPHNKNSIFLGFTNNVSQTNYWIAIPKASTFIMDAPIYTEEIFALLDGSNTKTTAQVTEFA